MDNIGFSAEEKSQIARKVQIYFREELEQDIGRFDAEFLIDFFAEQVGAYFYNRGIYDAQAVISKRTDELADALYELEKPTNLSK